LRGKHAAPYTSDFAVNINGGALPQSADDGRVYLTRLTNDFEWMRDVTVNPINSKSDLLDF